MATLTMSSLYVVILATSILVAAHSEAASNNPFKESRYYQELAQKINTYSGSTWKALFGPLKNLKGEVSFLSTENNSSTDGSRKKRYTPMYIDWRSTGNLYPPESQGACGSCWAFASVHALMDNLRIRSTSVILSTQHVLECCGSRACGGCSGASDNAAGFDFLSRKYTIQQVCKPYTFEGDPTTNPRYNIPGQRCSDYCAADNRPLSYSRKYSLTNFIRLDSDINKIITALATGPLLAAVKLFGDLYLYRSGIYRHINGPFLGYHSVEMVGYGYEAGQYHWILKNSWGQAWGENGYFRVAAGNNEVMIEEYVIQPLFSGEQQYRGYDDAFSAPVGGSRSANTSSPDIQEVADFIAHEIKPVCRDGKLDSDDMEVVRNGETYEVKRILHASTTVVQGIKYTMTAEMSLPRCSELMNIQATVLLSSANAMYSLQQYRYVPRLEKMNNARGVSLNLGFISIIVILAFI